VISGPAGRRQRLHAFHMSFMQVQSRVLINEINQINVDLLALCQK
jgi:hypothetical protein